MIITYILLALSIAVFGASWIMLKNSKKVLQLIGSVIMILASGFGMLYSTISVIDGINKDRPNELISINVKTKTNKLFKIDNKFLANSTPDDIYTHYSDNGKSVIDKLYGDNKTSRDYALTLIGKKLPETSLFDSNNTEHKINSKSVLVILNQGDKSKEFIKNLNEIKTQSNVEYLAVFPADTNDDAKKFASDTKLNNTWSVIAKDKNEKTLLRPALVDLAKNYFNVVGVPSYVAIENSRINVAGTGSISKDSLQNFVSQSFNKPKIYDMTTIQN